jgi:hypothetical protein
MRLHARWLARIANSRHIKSQNKNASFSMRFCFSYGGTAIKRVRKKGYI